MRIKDSFHIHSLNKMQTESESKPLLYPKDILIRVGSIFFSEAAYKYGSRGIMFFCSFSSLHLACFKNSLHIYFVFCKISLFLSLPAFRSFGFPVNVCGDIYEFRDIFMGLKKHMVWRYILFKRYMVLEIYIVLEIHIWFWRYLWF